MNIRVERVENDLTRSGLPMLAFAAFKHFPLVVTSHTRLVLAKHRARKFLYITSLTDSFNKV